MTSTLTYFFNYDRYAKSFSAYVVNNLNITVYEILSIDDMVDLIENDVMQDVDDIQGLEMYLKQERIIEQTDKIRLGF